MAETNIPPDPMSVILQKIISLEVSQNKLVDDNKELRDQLLNEVTTKRKRVMEADALALEFVVDIVD